MSTDLDDAGSASGTTRVRTRSSIVRLTWAARTHAGNRRQFNEDSWCASSPVFAVADGMGGHDSGEVASALAVGAMAGFASPNAVNATLLRRSIVETNRLIFDRSGGGAGAMGTTVAGLAVSDGPSARIAVFNVGDSRTYRFAGGLLEQISTDHSHVQELINAGQLSEDEAFVHPERNVVTRALGVDADVDVDLFVEPAVVGQRWLVCSDGLNGELTGAEMTQLVASGSPQEAAARLVDATLEGPARDNVTVVVVDVDAIEILDDPDRTDPRHGRDDTQPNRQADVPLPPVVVDLIDGVPGTFDGPAADMPPETVDVITDVPTAATIGVAPPTDEPSVSTGPVVEDEADP